MINHFFYLIFCVKNKEMFYLGKLFCCCFRREPMHTADAYHEKEDPEEIYFDAIYRESL
jgi:hypothetical protein